MPGVARSRISLGAGAVGLLLPVVFSPSVSAPTWTPRAALLLLVIAVGLPRLAVLLGGPARPAALAAVAFLAVGAVSAALAGTPALAVFGLYGWGTGLLFIAALVAAWALGAPAGGKGPRSIEGALLVAVGINVAVTLVQGAFDLRAEPFSRYQGRAAGLLGNPV